MPFTKHPGLVSCIFKILGHQYLVQWEKVAGAIGRSNPGFLGDSARHQSGPGGSTEWIHMKICEPNTLLVHPVEVGCPYDGVPMATKVGPALIIGHHNDDIQFVSRRRCKGMPDA
jgi:hypothetical protein